MSSPQVVFIRVHEPDAVREIIREAWDIARDETLNGADIRASFEKAADLLSARTMLQPMPQPVTLPFDLEQLRTGR